MWLRMSWITNMLWLMGFPMVLLMTFPSRCLNIAWCEGRSCLFTPLMAFHNINNSTANLKSSMNKSVSLPHSTNLLSGGCRSFKVILSYLNLFFSLAVPAQPTSCLISLPVVSSDRKSFTVSRRKVWGSPKPLRFMPWEPWMSVQNVVPIHPIVVEIFKSWPKWWTYSPTLPSTVPCR